MANKTYVELVNSAILESGADLSVYSTTGSDFVSNTDSLMRRFKEWVKKSWRTIQQDADDWHFLTSRGIVNIGPRIQFYVYGEIPGSVAATIDIYDSAGNVKEAGIPVTTVVDLTGGYGGTEPDKSYGYITIDPSAYPINFTLKPGNDYFYLSNRLDEISVGPGLYTFFDSNTVVGQTLSFVLTSGVNPPIYYENAGKLTELDPATGGSSIGTQGFKFVSTEPGIGAMIDSGTYDIFVYNHPLPGWSTENPYPPGSAANFSDITGATVTRADAKAFVHSWGSYDWNEEMSENDFVQYVKEVNPATYKVILTNPSDTGYPDNLLFVPWNEFQRSVEGSQNYPAIPRYISEDSQGRWRLWPYPKERVTVTFDYVRTPQELVTYNDIPQHLPEEYEDMIVWKALIYYGEFAEQPSVARRALKEYMNLKYGFEKNKRPVFNFRPATFGSHWRDT